MKILSRNTLFFLSSVVLAGTLCDDNLSSQLEIHRDETKNPAHIDEDNAASKQNTSQEAIEAAAQTISDHTPETENIEIETEAFNAKLQELKESNDKLNKELKELENRLNCTTK